MAITMLRRSSVIATYESHVEVDTAVKKLRKSGFNMNKLSIAGRDCHNFDAVVGFHNTGVRMMYLGKIEAFWSGSRSLIFGSVFLIIPGMGPVLAGGPLVGWIVGASKDPDLLDSLTACGAGIYSIGVPKDSALVYEAAIKTGKYVLIAHSRDSEVQRARETLDYTRANSLEFYQH